VYNLVTVDRSKRRLRARSYRGPRVDDVSANGVGHPGPRVYVGRKDLSVAFALLVQFVGEGTAGKYRQVEADSWDGPRVQGKNRSSGDTV